MQNFPAPPCQSWMRSAADPHIRQWHNESPARFEESPFLLDDLGFVVPSGHQRIIRIMVVESPDGMHRHAHAGDKSSMTKRRHIDNVVNKLRPEMTVIQEDCRSAGSAIANDIS